MSDRLKTFIQCNVHRGINDLMHQHQYKMNQFSTLNRELLELREQIAQILW